MTHHARKRFGQNFLTDPNIIQRIIDTIHPAAGELILEIGPGQAAISAPLAETGAELHLLEIDRDLASRLESRFGSAGNVTLHTVDALKADFGEIARKRPFRLVGNLPYNISTPLLFHVLQWKNRIIDMHFMLQREVVNRMAAGPGSKSWGRLSVMCQVFCNVSPLFHVPPGAFTPAPRVDSAFVRLVPHVSPPVTIRNMQTFERVVNQAFSMRRKTLRNSLKPVLDATRIEAAGIDPGLRPEALGLEQFAALSNALDSES